MTSTPFPFLKLPLELRESIYSLYFKPADRLQYSHALEVQGFFGGVYSFEFGLCSVNKQIYQEAKAVWRRENVFVKIATPWPSAGMYRVYLMATDSRDLPEYGAGGRINHISSEGLVPIVCHDLASEKFSTHHSLIRISAPFHQAVPEHSVIVLLDDLHLFTQTWYYSALSYPMLNDRLSTTFVLRVPYADEPAKTVNLALQRKLLLPFEHVKGLHHMDVDGYAPEVKAELERRMAIPIPTLAECVDSATDLMLKGDQALRDSDCTEALGLYRKAFRTIHILVHGRTRRVLGDVFFQQGITTGRYSGQSGITVRIVLRLKLVARYCLAYAKSEEWGEVAHWGMRSICIMRESMDAQFEDFISEFVGGEDVAMIYVRTGLAFWKMETEYEENSGTGHASKWRAELASFERDDFARSNKLWGVAHKYTKSRDSSSIRKELESFGVPKGVIRTFGDGESAGASNLDSTST